MKTLAQAVLAACLLTVVPAAAQIPVSIRVFQDDGVIGLANGGAVTLNTRLGTSTSVDIDIVYRGSGALTLSASPDLVGSSGFTIDVTGAYPQVLANGGSTRIRATYRPRTSSVTSAQFTIPISEQLPTTQPNTPAPPPTPGFVVVNLIGTAPEFVVSYILPADGNVVPLASGSPIELPAMLPDTQSTAVVSIVNRGSGSGQVTAISVAGDGFVAQGIPLLPGFLEANREFRFNLRFGPRAVGNYTGTLTVGAAGDTQRFPLATRVVPIELVYELALNDQITAVTPGQVVNLGDVLPGDTTTFQLSVRNAGQLEVPLTGVSLTGNGFVAVESPAARTIAVGQTVRLVVTFAPTAPGSYRARVRINNDTFEFTGTATGARLRYTYTLQGTQPAAVNPGSTIFIPSTAIGERTVVRVDVSNTGSSPTNVVQISLDNPRAGYSLTGLPALPRTLAPGETVSFQVVYAPQALNAGGATLRIDGAAFPLSAVTPNTPPIPELEFTPGSGTVQALEQPAISLRLARAYPLEITGVLNLTQEPAAFVTDPSVRFINGQTTVTFVIPANSTTALFPNGATQIRLQTGSVAGDIVIGAFLTAPVATGDAQNPVRVLRLTVPPTAPRLLAATGIRNGQVLTIQVSGISTTRSLTRLEVEFKPRAGVTLTTPKLTINVEAESLLWFRSAASQGFGGVFQLSVPLTFTVTGTANESPIESLTVSVANERGTSNTVTAPVP
jgi:hypothetical protein